MGRRLWPVLSLLVLSPLIAEYLLGSLPLSLIFILPLMAALYGSAAILIREWARRTGRGWPTMILLATAYGLFEEGFVTQSLFNPNYLHLRLLDFGFVPALGTGLPWLIFVITIHVVWSISVPIALTEGLFKTQRTTPWLCKVGLVVFSLLLLGGAALIFRFSYQQVPFLATPGQLVVTGVIFIALIVAAFSWPKTPPPREKKAPRSWVLFAASLGAGSALMVMQHLAQDTWHWDWVICVAAVLALEAAFVAGAVLLRGRTWTDFQRYAFMAGGLTVYVWAGFGTDASLHGPASWVPHAFVAGAFVGLCVLAGVVARRKT
jgi:hypothetical protein